MFEEGAVATPYIPTEGSQVTVATTLKSDDLSGVKTSEFTVMFYKKEHPRLSLIETWKSAIDIITSSGIRLLSLHSRPNVPTYLLSGSNFIKGVTTVSGINEAGNLVLAFRDGVLKLFFNGELIVESGPANERGEIELGRMHYTASSPSYVATGYHKQTLFFDRALSDEEAKELTL